MKQSKKRTPRQCLVVATAHTDRGVRQAVSLRTGCGIDLVEIRLDCLAGNSDRLGTLVRKIKLPIILTARHPLEGGAGRLGSASRAQILERFLPSADFVDIELRSVPRMRSVLASAKRHRVRLILSFHDFKKTPSLAVLRRKIRQALRSGAAVVKIATVLGSPRDLAALLTLQEGSGKLAAMGMGSLGKVSRLVLPMAGARLVYGYLDRPQVEGQWPAEMLSARLAELAP